MGFGSYDESEQRDQSVDDSEDEGVSIDRSDENSVTFESSESTDELLNRLEDIKNDTPDEE
jgi:hypothetical protein